MQTRRLAHARTLKSIQSGPGRQIVAGWRQARQTLLHVWGTGVGRLGLCALGLALVVPLAVVIMRRASTDAAQFVLCLAISGLTSVLLYAFVRAVARVAYRNDVRVQIGMPVLLTALVIGLNVVLLSRLMFLSSADVQLLLAFVAFGMAIAVVLISPVSRRLARTLSRIDLAARRLAAGDYGARIAEDDAELIPVARSLNQIGVRLQVVAARQRAAEGERRQLVRALSHELRTPISAIQAIVEAIADGVVTDSATMERYHNTLRAQTRDLAALLDELFELTRLEAGAPALQRQHVCIEELLFDAVDAIRECAEQRHLRLETQIGPALPLLDVDPAMIHRVVETLLQHALRAVPEGGVILLRAALVVADGPDGETEQGAVAVEVIDSGEGIDSAQLPYLFEPGLHAQVSREYGSCPDDAPGESRVDGWNLAIAARVVQAHGGSISVVSPLSPQARDALTALGQSKDTWIATAAAGVLVRFTLPVTLSHLAQSAGAQSAGKEFSQSRHRL